MSSIAASLVTLCLIMVAAPTSAQHVKLKTSRQCACEIRLTEFGGIWFGQAADLGGIATRFLTRDGRGRYYHSNNASPGVLLVFDSLGTFIRSVGGPGGGPGEFGMIWDVVVGPGDTLHVLDATARRRTVLSPNFAVVKTDNLPGTVYGGALLTDGRLVLNMVSRSRAALRQPLHIFDPRSRRIISFGKVTGKLVADERPSLRPLVVAGRDSIWSAQIQAYVVELWNDKGERLASFERAVDWFKPYESYLPYDDKNSPQPFIADIMVDGNRRVWVVAVVPRKDWKRYTRPMRDPNLKRLVLQPVAPEIVYETMVEVLDPRTAEVLASRRVPGRAVAFPSKEILAVFSTDEFGRGRMSLFRTELAQTRRAR